MEVKNLTCIGCPMGCALAVEMEGKEVVRISGNTCKRGDMYARKEVIAPARIVTSTVKVVCGKSDIVSVKTKEEIPKGKIFACIRELKNVQAEAPVHIGDVVAVNIAGTGVDVVATRNIELL